MAAPLQDADQGRHGHVLPVRLSKLLGIDLAVRYLLLHLRVRLCDHALNLALDRLVEYLVDAFECIAPLLLAVVYVDEEDAHDQE